MGGTGFVELVVRSIVSLAIVLGFIAVAYGVAKRRATGGGRGGVISSNRQRRSGLTGSTKSTRAPARLETIGRVGLARGSVAIAVRFGDQVVLLGVADGSPISLLQEMPAERWDELSEIEHVVSTTLVPDRTDRTDRDGVTAPRPTFVEALREATIRRA